MREQSCYGNKTKYFHSALHFKLKVKPSSSSCQYLAGGSQQGTVMFPTQTLHLVAVLLQNCRHTV